MLLRFGASSASRVPLHPRESERLAAVCGLCDPERGRDALLDRVAESAAALFDAPIGLVTFIDEWEQRFGGLSGADFESTSREDSICAHTILQDGPLIVEDVREDPRFARLPIVTEAPFLRAYFGASVVDAGGLPIGSVCVLDMKPRPATFREIYGLERLATKVGVILETRKLMRELAGGSSGDFRTRSLDRLDAILAPLGTPLGEPCRTVR